MQTDILEVFMDEFRLLHTGRPDEVANIVTSITWHFPRQNVAALTVALPFEKTGEPCIVTPAHDSYMERILFKEERLGDSFFSVEVDRVDDPGIFGKLLSEFLGWSIKQVANPYAGIGLRTILEKFNISAEKVVSVASGKALLANDTHHGNVHISLKSNERLLIQRGEIDFDFDEFSDEEESGEWLQAGNELGHLSLSIARLQTT